MQPTIGRIICYKRYTGQDPLPAIIIRVEGGGTTLTLLHLDLFTREGVEYVTTNSMATGPQEAVAGQWFWPERV